MESITGRRPLLAALGRGLTPADRSGFLLGAAFLVAATAVDVWVGGSESIVAGFVIAPFLAASAGSVLATLVFGLVAVGLGFASGSWDHNFGELGYWIRGSEVVLGSAFAVIAAIARDRARVNARRLAVLDSVGAIADGSLALAETLERVTGAIVPIAADMCMIDAIHDGRVRRAAVQVEGRPDARQIEERLRRRRPSIPSRFVTGERAWMRIAHFRRRVDDEELRRMAEGPEDLAFLRSLGPRSMVTAAMTARGRSLGTLTLVTAWSKRRYTPDDVRFAQVLANRIGLALDNAGLFSDLESVERRLDAVMSMLDEAVVVHDAGGNLVYANETAARWLALPNPEAMLDAELAELLGRFRLWNEAGEPVDEGEIADRVRAGRLPRRALLRAEVASPRQERWVVVSSEPIRGPDGAVLYAVTTAEDVTGLKRSEFAEQLLARTGELLASSNDSTETLRAAPRIAVPGFADWCSVNVRVPEGALEEVATAHGDPEKLAVAEALRERDPVWIDEHNDIGRVVHTGEALLLPEISAGTPHRAPDARRVGHLKELEIGSAIVVPMTAGAKAIGVLVFGNGERSRVFDENDLAIAVEIARRVGLAAENARLAGEQADAARVLQRGLRPRELPEIPGFELATMYRSAGEATEVGGDFYDAFRIDSGWMVVIGDVTGRGVAAASLTGLARYTIQTAGILTGNPYTAARIVDETLKREPELSLCSAVILVVPDADADPVPISILAAGHPLPLLVRSGLAQAVGEPGALLGAPDEHEWELTTVDLSHEDLLILYTDGVTEARGEHDRFGEERLRACLGAVADPVAAVARVEAELESFGGEPPEDDAAVLAIMRSAAVPEPTPQDTMAGRAAAATGA